ncbi:sigma-70 family RNA polymerase sigma factor [Ruminococcus flavefaciens]|jgi:RNA polymerase sigma-70 factor (ECF subfamily)|uniref:sigma-70 family RNA polymerase sigma factor n=1 Tax=Ruminococcus flavefaciens TaxID=1265 RepID=UPI0006880969|nr:sigma-70 family RNA polymerase sigma factor [Ruminococcus flavefaciens]
MYPEKMTEIYDKYSNAVYRMAFAYCKNKADAEDIMQEVFIRRFSADIVFEDEAKEKSWLLKVTVNKCRDMFRSLRYKYSLTSIPLEEADIIYETQEESDVYHAVMSLPNKYRTVIHLFYYEEYTIKEISAITGDKETAIQTQLYRARKKLKDILGKELRL